MAQRMDPGQLASTVPVEPRGNPEAYERQLRGITLPQPVSNHVAAYEKSIGHRDSLVWKWVYNLFEAFTLPTVPDSKVQDAETAKLLLTLYVTTADDLVEHDNDPSTFAKARTIPFESESPLTPDANSPGDSAVLEFLRDLWVDLQAALESAPRYPEFRDLFRYDLRQVWNAIDYSRVLNEHTDMANHEELRRNDTHNMALFPYVAIDLMYSPAFDRTDLGRLRSLVWQLQQMARIGNWISTWERELSENDYTSGVVVRAIERGIIDPETISPTDHAGLQSRIERHDIESELLSDWDRLRRAAEMEAGRIDSFDAGGLVDGMTVVLRHHLASDGLK